MSYWVGERLRITPNIRIGVHSLPVALDRVHRQEASHHRVVVPRVVIVESGQAIVVLARVPFARANTPFGVALIAIWPIRLVAQHRGTPRRVAHTRHHTAQRIGEQKRRREGAGSTQGSQQFAT